MRKLLFLVLLLAFPALASTDRGALTGRVLIGEQEAAGVTVAANSSALMHERTTMTGPRGTYWLGELPPGTYDVTFSRKGMQTLTRRAIVELGRVARADATLEPSEDEESVTSTATSMSVADTTVITTHFSDEELDRLPLLRKLNTAEALAPEATPGFASADDVGLFEPFFLGEEALQEGTVIRGAVPIDHDFVVLGRTRQGGEDFSLSVRGTASRATGNDEIEPLIETASGGHVIPEKLWFFAAGWSGDTAGIPVHDLRGYEVKFSAQPFAAHHFVAELLKADTRAFGSTTAIARYLGVFSDRFLADATLSHIDSSFGIDGTGLKANGSYVLPTSKADHVLTFGGMTNETTDAVYANDRLSLSRFTFDLGARWSKDDTTARIAGAFDLHGDGRQAVIANWSDDVSSLGFATVLGSTGFARADVVRRGGRNELQLESRYSLFGRLDLGATYLYSDRDDAQRAAAWAGVQLPIGNHEFGVTLLQRYTDLIAPTDLALRYTIPFAKFGLTIASDVTNVFHHEGDRAMRVWLRLRV